MSLVTKLNNVSEMGRWNEDGFKFTALLVK